MAQKVKVKDVTQLLYINLPIETKKKLDEMAKREGRFISVQAARIITEFFETKGNAA